MDKPKLRALDLLSYSDSDFDCALRDIMPSSRTAVTYIDLQGWTELPGSDKLRVKQMIKNWMRSYKSHAVDLDQVNARLLKVNTSPTPPEQPQETTTTVTTPDADEEGDEYLITEEAAAYQDIVADGGRPWYPFHLFEHVRKHHAEHHEMLRFWCSEGDWNVFSKQRERWKSFRRWQDDNRGLLNVQAEFEKQKAAHLRYYARHGGDIDGLDTEKRWADEFERFENRRGWEHDYTVEHGLSRKQDKDRFPAYAIAVRARLDRHGFTRAVQLDPDPRNQDTWTTWIEYLNYEYWVHDGFVDKATRAQSERKELLKTIAETGMLWPGETTESIARFHYDFNLKAKHEKRSASEAVKAAESAVSSAQQALDSIHQASNRESQEDKVARARERLEQAVAKVTWVGKRAELIFKYSQLDSPQSRAVRLAEQHKILLQGILDQIPLIEAEMAEAKTDASCSKEMGPEGSDVVDTKAQKADAQADQEVRPGLETKPPAQPCASSARKRARSNDNLEDMEGPDLKKRKLEAEVNREVAPEPDALPETPAKSSQRTRNGRTQAAPADPPPLRRSARITALQEKALREATAREAVAKSPSTTVSKVGPRSKKRKATEKQEKTPGPQRKRRRTAN